MLIGFSCIFTLCRAFNFRFQILQFLKCHLKISMGSQFYMIHTKILCWKKKFYCKNEIENFEKINFTIFLSNSIFQYQKLIGNDISFHLMYVLSILDKNYRFSKIFILEADNLAWSDEVTSVSHFGKSLNHSMVFKEG